MPSTLPIPTPAVPTLQLERDALPSSCGHCGSRALQRVAGAGGEHFGTLGCFRCGTIAAYVAEPPPPIGATREQRLPDDALPGEPKPRTVYVERAVGFEVGPDCTGACGPAPGHAPHAHREAGIRAAYAEMAATGTPLVRTGPLAVDLAARACWVDGRPVRLVGRGLAVLLALAEAHGRALSWEEINARVWPELDDGRRGPYHRLSVVVVRLRGALGPEAGRLVATVHHHGFRLARMPYSGPEDLAPPEAAPAARAWARRWPACRGCGTTERAHKAHGLCTRCQDRRRAPAARGRGRPRKDTTTS